MSISTQIEALQADKASIAAAITAKGGTVSAGDGFDDFAADIATIPSGGSSIYKFYLQDGVTEIPMSNWTIEGLENAYYYTKNGGTQARVGGRIFHINCDVAEGTADKFYAYYTSLQTSSSSNKWSTDTSTAMNCTTNTIGSGKTNSAIMDTAMGDTGNTIWNWVKHFINGLSLCGCYDWYIGSAAENDLLRSSGLEEDWFSSIAIWSSVESLLAPSISGCYWSYMNGVWSTKSKTNSYSFFVIRSF